MNCMDKNKRQTGSALQDATQKWSSLTKAGENSVECVDPKGLMALALTGLGDNAALTVNDD
jgi:hypothetical protein